MIPTVVIRADGSTPLGHGHVFRTLTLADELAVRGWAVHYVCRDLEGAPLARIREAGHDLALLPAGIDEADDASATASVARETGASWIVVDRYATDDGAHELWRERGFKVLAIDDICYHPFPVNILLNQNAGADGLRYETLEETVRLLGPRYALVRQAYRRARPAKLRKIDQVRHVMVFMGGSDPDDSTGRVLAALEAVDRRLQVEVVVGSGYTHLDQIRRAAEASRHHVEVHRDLLDLIGPMSRADVAISAGGSVTWELCCMRVPMLLLPLAENQVGVTATLAQTGAAIRINADDLTRQVVSCVGDPTRLAEIARIAHGLVDGTGPVRVADAMERRSSKTARDSARLVAVRPANLDDALFLWELANERDVRANSFNTGPIPWEDHMRWLNARLPDPSTVLLVAIDDGSRPCGQIRFDVQGREAELNYSLAPDARGSGRGAGLIEAGLQYLFENTLVDAVTALVKIGNTPSLVTFERAGWFREADVTVRGARCARFKRPRVRNEQGK